NPIRFSFVLFYRKNYFASAASLSKISLFLVIWLPFGILLLVPNSTLRPNFKNCTSRRAVVLFLLSFLFKRVTPIVQFFLSLKRGRKRIRTAVGGFADLSLATRPSDPFPIRGMQK